MVGQAGSTNLEDQADQKKFDCPRCKDKEGYLVSGDDGYEYWRYCECRERRKIERLFKSSHITPAFQKLGFKNFRLDGMPQPIVDAYNCAVTYYRNFQDNRESRHNSIALLGEPGAGKTHLLMAVSNCLISQGVGVTYFPWVEGFNELKDNLDHLDDRIQKLQNAPVLFIDDLYKGRAKPTEFQLEQLFAIVNFRYLNNLPLLVSSEREVDELCKIDKAIGSRIYEMARDYTVILNGMELNYRIHGGATG